MSLTETNHTPKDRSQFISVMNELSRGIKDRQNLSFLVVGGSADDVDSLRKLGFENITLSNLVSVLDPSTIDQTVGGMRTVAIDAQNMHVPDNTYDLVFAHEVLHHCRSPHRALCEMLRVSRKYVMFMEPNDSTVMRFLVSTRFSFPYELVAVIAHGGKGGGLGDQPGIPNFVYRWNRNEVSKTVSSFLPEYNFSVRAYPYWDFNIDERGLRRRTMTKLRLVTNTIGAKNFLAMLRFGQGFFNRVPFLRAQGNKFLCLIEKHPALKPWLAFEGNEIVFNKTAIQSA